MNNNKFAFIICTNNKLYLNECIHYISCLNVPEGYETEILAIEGATGITKAYNEAIQSSDAKYKIYLHQDLFILNPDFLYEILRIFENPGIGMIGMAGIKIAKHFFENSLRWTQGSIYMNNIYKAEQQSFGTLDDNYTKVQAIDGIIMITQYDLPWREDKYTGWHYYDLSQSMEFLKNGYEIVVPNPKEPWVLHDHGIVNYDMYEYWKSIFLEENSEFLNLLASNN